MSLREQAIEAVAKSGWLMGEWEDSPYRKLKEERLADSEAQLDALLDLLDSKRDSGGLPMFRHLEVVEGFGGV